MKEKISVIVPCYNEEEALPYFYDAIINTAEQMNDFDFEFIFVNDGSKDRTLELSKQLAKKDPRVKYVSFSRNFGKEAAIYAGLENSTGDYCVLMDADLQDPPALLPEMMEAIQKEGYDSAATRRVTRKGEPPIRSFFARMFYRIINKISDADIVDGARDYRLMKRDMVNTILDMKEYNRFSKGIFGWIGYDTKWIEFENVERVAGETKWSFWKLFKYSLEGITAFSIAPLQIASIFGDTKWIEFENVERVAGETKWSFWKLFKYSLEGITAFSIAPLQIASIFGILFSLVAFVMIIVIIIRTLVFGDPVSGWPSLVCIIMLIGGVQLLSIGILGQYLSKTYLETKKRPIYIAKETNVEGIE